MALHVAFVFNQFQESMGVVDVTVADCKYRATAPVTCGADIEVPVSFAYVFVANGQLEIMV